jgi:hypothetical protein
MGPVRDVLGCRYPVSDPVWQSTWPSPLYGLVALGSGGAPPHTPDEIEDGVSRMKAELGDLPCGVDMVVPAGMPEHDDR